MSTTIPLIPIYTTRGDVGAYLHYPNLYNATGEWIGWVTTDKNVYSVDGVYVGYITKEPRILRKKEHSFNQTRLPPPKNHLFRVNPPATVPLAPLMAELAFNTIDVLYEEPEMLHTIDSGELKEDMD